MPKNPSFVSTPPLQAALRQLDDVRVRGGILLLVGEAGTGKSDLLAHYAATREAGVWAGPVLLYRTDVVNTPLGLVQALLSTRGVRWRGDTRGGLYYLQTELPSGAMLLVDDAHRLAVHSLDALRRLHERSGLRLVLAGPPELPRVLRRKCLPLLHRVHGQVTLAPVPAADVSAFVQSQVRRAAVEPLADTLAACSERNFYWLSEGLRLAQLAARNRHVRLSPGLVAEVFDKVARTR